MNQREWEEKVYGPFKEKKGERKEKFTNDSKIEIDPLYTPKGDEKFAEEVGFPGVYPFARGVYPTMYRGRLWTMRQYAGYSTPEETNERFRYLISQGQTGLSVAFDLPTQIGYDSDHIMSSGEVGKVGVPINTVDDMDQLLEGIDLSKVSISMTINSTAILLLAFLVAVARRRGMDPSRLRGTIQNDILKEYIARGTYRFPPQPSLRLIADTFSYCRENLPSFNPISISGYHIREAGSTAVQEVAFTLANGIAYVQTGVEAGLEVDEFAGRLSFFFGAHNDFFEEVAKFRAARRLWAKIMKERFGATNKKAMMLRFHTQTCGSTLTATQPDNNIIRVALQALSAVLGGTQSLHTNGKDEALSLPSESSALLALRTQQIIAHESGVTHTIDPLGGSPYIEKLTDEIEDRARELMDQIENKGGAVDAIEEGFIQHQIRQSAYRKQVEIETGRQVLVGQNKFTDEDQKREAEMEAFKLDPQRVENRLEKIRAYRKERDEAGLPTLLERVKEAAKDSNQNLFPPILEALEGGATLGEVVDSMVGVFGEYRDAITLA